MAHFQALCKSVFAPRVNQDNNLRRYPRLPKMPDIEMIALALAAESERFTSENQLYDFIQVSFPALFQRLPCRQSYNRRIKQLRDYTDEFASKIADYISDPNAPIIVDSTPLPICRFVRAPRLKICKDALNCLPKHGRLVIDKHSYFGFKLHLACCPKGTVHNYFLAPANRADITQLINLTNSLSDKKIILGDKGYISQPIQLSLFEDRKITVCTPLRTNQRTIGTWTKAYGKTRRRIETLFSQLIDQFHLRTNFAKTTNGLLTRLTYKICTISCIQFLNHQLGLPLGNLKSERCFQ
jgi:hypothetical protein